jgi:hypothetical protein
MEFSLTPSPQTSWITYNGMFSHSQSSDILDHLQWNSLSLPVLRHPGSPTMEFSLTPSPQTSWITYNGIFSHSQSSDILDHLQWNSLSLQSSDILDHLQGNSLSLPVPRHTGSPTMEFSLTPSPQTSLITYNGILSQSQTSHTLPSHCLLKIYQTFSTSTDYFKFSSFPHTVVLWLSYHMTLSQLLLINSDQFISLIQT